MKRFLFFLLIIGTTIVFSVPFIYMLQLAVFDTPGERVDFTLEEITDNLRDPDITPKPDPPSIISLPGQPADREKIAVEPSEYEARVIELINLERTKKGLEPFMLDKEITWIVRLKSEDMRDKGYLYTADGTLSKMLQDNHLFYSSMVEKVAGGGSTPREVFDLFMKDAGFRESIFNENYNRIGVGHASGGGGLYEHYWTLCIVQRPDPLTPDLVPVYEQEVLRLVNVEREKRGLNPLKWDSELSKAARFKSEDMRDHNYFDHESPTFGSLENLLGFFKISYSSAGENLAGGLFHPEDAVEGWMNSPGHRENILNPQFTHLGVGYADGDGYFLAYWTQIFISK